LEVAERERERHRSRGETGRETSTNLTAGAAGLPAATPAVDCATCQSEGESVARHAIARLTRLTLACSLGTAPLPAQRPAATSDPKWTEAFPAFRIAGNLYYVGSRGLASYLIATPQGHILINSNLEESV